MDLLTEAHEFLIANEKNICTTKSFMSPANSFRGVPNIKLLSTSKNDVQNETIFRRNGKSVDKIIEYDKETGAKVKTTHFDYFNDKKIRYIDEFSIETGRKIRTTNYVLYKSVDEYDPETGKKLRTINYDLRDENKLSSIQEYDLELEKVSKISIYRKDGKSVSIVKEMDPESEKVTKWTSFKEDTQKVSSVSEYEPEIGKPVKTTYFYDDGVTVQDVHEYNSQNGDWKQCMHFDRKGKVTDLKTDPKYRCGVKEFSYEDKAKMAKLIDNLFRNKLKFEAIS